MSRNAIAKIVCRFIVLLPGLVAGQVLAVPPWAGLLLAAAAMLATEVMGELDPSFRKPDA